MTRKQVAEIEPMRRLTQNVTLFNGLIVTLLTALYLKNSVLISPAFHIGAIAAVIAVTAVIIARAFKFARGVKHLESRMDAARQKYEREIYQAKAALALKPAGFDRFVKTARRNLDAVMNR